MYIYSLIEDVYGRTIDIAMLAISTLLTTWLSVMERIRETTETGEAYVSKETMFWLDILSIVILFLA